VQGQLSAGLSVSIVMDTFKVCGDTGPANVILSLSLAHAARCLVSAAHVRTRSSATAEKQRVSCPHGGG